MNIGLFIKELEQMGKGLEPQLRNSNEIYIKVSPDSIKDLTAGFIGNSKLKFVTQFCRQENEAFIISVILCHRKEGFFLIMSYTADGAVISLGDIVYQSYLFDREIADTYGLSIQGGKDTRNLVKHEIWESDVYPLRKDFEYGRKIKATGATPEYRFKEVTGEGGYQIPVGPVHAGIIEPGHFRFSVIGEPIENLEIRLMYKHRGIEKLCENMNIDNLNVILERVAGESTVAYAEAWAQLAEKLTGYEAPIELKALRVVLLELERIYNYLDDIAGICVDIAYSYPAKKFGYFSEQLHQLCERLTGSRYLRNSIVPCGSGIELKSMHREDILNTLAGIRPRLEKIIAATLDEVSFLDRVENTGLVYGDTAKKLYLTGVVGRACGISYDVRHSFGYELYKNIKKKVNVLELGGVFERYLLKIEEIRDAFDFIQAALSHINTDIARHKPHIELKEGLEAVAAVETVKGELVVYGQTGKNNRMNRLYLKTPSFTNWLGLTYAVQGEIVPDFPLCNKSFNMSYSENDR